MVTKLFNAVNVYDTLGLASINPAAAEDVQIDLASIDNSVDVVFPAAGTEGQAIGVTLRSESLGSAVGYSGAVDVLVPATLARAGDCDLFTWDADNSVWMLVASLRQGRPFNNVVDVTAVLGTTEFNVSPGDVVRVVMAADADSDVTANLPTLACIGQAIAVRMVVNNSAGFVVNVGTGQLRKADDTLLLVWDGSQWGTVLQQSGSAASGFGLSFTDADLGGGADLMVAHLLNTQAPVIAIYSDTGALVPPGAGGYTVQVNNGVQCTITFDAGLLPLSGTWHLNLLGYPI